ncbi:MAG: hypothetical protein AB7G39_03365 [Alphaproteobacteria bacterium]
MQIQNLVPGMVPLPVGQQPAGYASFTTRDGWIIETGIPVPPRTHPQDGSTDDDAMVTAA